MNEQKVQFDRDILAKEIFVSYLANPYYFDYTDEKIASYAYRAADAFLEQQKKENKK